MTFLGSSKDRTDNWMNTLEERQTKVDHQSIENVLQMRRVQAHQDTQSAALNRMQEDLENFWEVVTTQSSLIHLQTEVVQEYSRRNDELSERVRMLEEVRRLRVPQGRTLGDLIVVKDDNNVKEEERIPGVVYNLILLDD